MRLRVLLIFMLSLNKLLVAQNNTDSETMTFNLNEIAMLNIAPNNNTVILNLNSPSQPGEQVTFTSSNNSKWINFTSAIASTSSPRNLYVKIESGTTPPGLDLKLEVNSFAGVGQGSVGTPSSPLTLNTNNQILISNIGGAYTGYGSNNGYKLTYYLEITDYTLLNMDNSEVLSISLTLTDF